MSVASDAEFHKREESRYRYFMEQLVWLERDAIHSGDIRSDSYWQFDEAVGRKSVLTVSRIRSDGPRWCFEVGNEDASRFSLGCECILSQTFPEVDGVWARGRYETVRIAAWRTGIAKPKGQLCSTCSALVLPLPAWAALYQLLYEEVPPSATFAASVETCCGCGISGSLRRDADAGDFR